MKELAGKGGIGEAPGEITMQGIPEEGLYQMMLYGRKKNSCCWSQYVQ